ncbi:Protein SPIRAL1 [Zea mays]|uniref:Protein SPIRAL1 n=3 Tax=Zea mays TaxID=4577 RepID=A0A1D6P8A0_MAIZE|nr:Protein SPIRAL1 [Zea mays]
MRFRVSSVSLTRAPGAISTVSGEIGRPAGGVGPIRPRFLFSIIKMSRGGSAGGGQSSLGYLFGSGEPPKPAVAPAASAPPVEKPSAAKTDAAKQVAAGVTSQTNNYHRADGQNTGNFLTDRPSTKVHAAPGGGSSLGYLFGGN